MGEHVSNVVSGPHYSGGQRVGYKVHVHLGSAGLATFSPDATDAAFGTFRMAAVNGASDADLDALGVTAWGSWYTTNVAGVTGARAQLRLGVQDLKAP